MIAVVEFGSKQYIVKVGDKIEVDNQNQEIGSEITVNPLLVADEAGNDVIVGKPVVEGKKVVLKVLEDFRADKITVFKMKAKKRYSRTKGFRAERTELEVLSIA